MRFLNENKRIVVAIVSVIVLIVLMLPMSRLDIETKGGNANKNLSVFNTSRMINGFKDTYGIEKFDTSKIDKDHPADDYEKATVVLHDVSVNISFANFLLALVFLSTVIGAMVIYVRPKSLFGTVCSALAPLFLILQNVVVVSAINLINQNRGIIQDYFSMKDGFALQYRPLITFYIAEILLILGFGATVFLTKPRQENNESEKLARLILAVCALISVLSVFFIVLFLLLKGVPTINEIGFTHFIFNSNWDPTGATPSFGIFNLIVTSFVGTFGAVLIGVPLGILAAIFISQIVGAKIAGFLSAVINLLAGIPSVIYGAVGAIVLVPFVRKLFGIPTGATLFSAMIVLAIMVLPTIVSVTVTSLNALPGSFLEASLALGLTREATVFKLLIPAARSGIMTGVLLGVGRAIGEAMAIILVAGNAPIFPQLFKPARFLTTGIVAEMGYATGLHQKALFAIGLVLFFFILVINSFFKYIIRKASRKYER